MGRREVCDMGKRLKRLMILMMAAAFVLGLGTEAMAYSVMKFPSDLTGPASISITLPERTDRFTEKAAPEYKIYKVFDAVPSADGSAISYKLADGKTMPPSPTANSKFDVDAAGNVQYYTKNKETGAWEVNPDVTEMTEDDIAAIKAYVTESMLKAYVSDTRYSRSPVKVQGLPYGYYYITTTTGSLVTVNSTNPNANVADKNTIPTVTKIITDANDVAEDGKNGMAQANTDVAYESVITVGTGAVNYTFFDRMTWCLEYNNDVKVWERKVTPSEDPEGDPVVSEEELSPDHYTVVSGPIRTVLDTTPSLNDPKTGLTNQDKRDQEYTASITSSFHSAFTVTFDNDYIQALEPGTELVLRYSCKVGSSSSSYFPYADTNDSRLFYGNDPSLHMTPGDYVKTYNAFIGVQKLESNGTSETESMVGLPGAGFKLKNSAGKWYQDNQEEIDAWYDEAHEAGAEAPRFRVNWVDSQADGTERITGGLFGEGVPAKIDPFMGLAPGTYTLVETTVPAGFNRAKDVDVTIESPDYSKIGSPEWNKNLAQTKMILNEKGSLLPSTGGPGTKMFYWMGLLILVGTGLTAADRRRRAA